MTKNETQSVTTLNCTGFQRIKVVGEKSEKLTEIGGNTTVGALVEIGRAGARKIICPLKKDGMCNRNPEKSYIHRVNCPYESDSKK